MRSGWMFSVASLFRSYFLLAFCTLAKIVMDLNTIKDAFDRVSKKQRLRSSKAQEVIDQVGWEIESSLAKMQCQDSTSLDNKSVITELNNRLKEIEPINQLEGSQKELSVGLSKYAKFLEKTFTMDISKAYRNVEFDSHVINQIIASHFYRQGLFDLGDFFIDEANEPVASSLKTPILEMYQIHEAMKIRNLEPALAWAAANREHLLQNGSSLELKLHRLQFVEILKHDRKENRDEALKYARTHLAPFASTHMTEIQKLMACLLWPGKLDRSPYAEFLSPSDWDKLSEELTRQFCGLLGQSYESPLSVAIAAGVQCLPSLLKLAGLLAVKKQDWQAIKQLPVAIDLGREFQFHSIFVCPVSKEPVTEDNPPMLMPCGHVLCKQSIVKLSKGSTRTFKCPYCPQECSVAQCRQLYF